MGVNSTNESEKQNKQKQKSHSHELSRRNLSSNLPSRKNDAAKIQINRETAITNLEKLEKSYQQNNKIRGFLICIKSALGLKPTQGASGYGIVSIPQNDGAVLEATISPTNHHANAQTYIDNDCNLEYNLKISVRKKQMRGKFKPHKDVVLDEYEYTGKELRKVDNALALIIRSIIGFLETGVYEDLTGVAVVHRSP
jgi:hypothetical protein